jgi:hypothetical protein
VAQEFAAKGEGGTVFVLEVATARRVGVYSAYPEEDELVLLPGTRLEVREIVSGEKLAILGSGSGVVEAEQAGPPRAAPHQCIIRNSSPWKL